MILTFLLLTIGVSFLPRAVDASGLIGNILGCLDSATVDYSRDYFPTKVSPAYSKLWNVTYHKTYKIVYNKLHNASYLLYQCGSKPPSSEVGRHNATFMIPPVAGVAVTESDQIPPLEQLDLRLKIKAFIGSPMYLASPCLQKLRDDKNLTILADPNDPTYSYYNGYYYPFGSVTNVSDFLTKNPSVIIFDSDFGERETSYPNNTFVVSAFYESSSVAKYEWSKVYSALFNEEATANSNFDAALSRYLCTSANAAFLYQKETKNLTTQQQQNSKPTVLWAYYIDYGKDVGWDVGECKPTFNYYCELAQQCSANLLTSSSGNISSALYPGQRYMTNEEFFAFGKNVSYWIYPGYNWDTVYKNNTVALSQFASVKNNQVYDVRGSGDYAWFEQATAEFDIVLQDFCAVVHLYDEAIIPYKRKYLRKLLPTSETLGSLGNCTVSDLSKPWDSRAASCTFLSQQKTSSSSYKLVSVALYIVSAATISLLA